MAKQTLQEFLSQRILSALKDHLGEQAKPLTFCQTLNYRSPTIQINTLVAQAHEIAEELVKEALLSGLSLNQLSVESQSLGGGNTAEIVDRIVLHAPFVFKFDTYSVKLANEAKTMRKIKQDERLSQRFREAWPAIYAVREISPYAYLMEIFPKEDDWVSWEDLLYPQEAHQALSLIEVMQMGGSVLDLMFEGFTASIDKHKKPNLFTYYVDRISERLRATETANRRFAPKNLLVNGQKMRPWSEYLAVIDRHKEKVNNMAPPFSTVAHGDPNPGNLMIRLKIGETEIKFIDPKEWGTGDYLFDIAKLTHFLEVTGPVEKPIDSKLVELQVDDKSSLTTIFYHYPKPIWTEPLVRACYGRASAFAIAQNDAEFAARYELAMASNLLGLPLGRLTHRTSPRSEAAWIQYAEGLRWLDLFCARLEGIPKNRPSFVSYAEPTVVEAEPLKRFRDSVTKDVAGVRQTTGRHGSQLLQWPPNRPNAQNKLQELSLEHEARLKPGSEQGLQQLLENLHGSGERPLKNGVLLGESPFADYCVRRLGRATGPQSVDHYYEVPHIATHGRLIPRMYTLRRRLRTSSFMTWAVDGTDGACPQATGQACPLNLELPFVALGTQGLTAHLEFNWIDVYTLCLAEALDTTLPEAKRLNNPIYLAARMEGLGFDDAKPVIEHTTFREKFIFQDSAGQDAFALNIDRITAQALSTGRIGSYVDVDISSLKRIDELELEWLSSFCEAIVKAYGLVPNLCTKAWRDALVVGLLEA